LLLPNTFDEDLVWAEMKVLEKADRKTRDISGQVTIVVHLVYHSISNLKAEEIQCQIQFKEIYEERVQT
jgi:uncharacterized protein YeeX (DUF496 family)